MSASYVPLFGANDLRESQCTGREENQYTNKTAFIYNTPKIFKRLHLFQTRPQDSNITHSYIIAKRHNFIYFIYSCLSLSSLASGQVIRSLSLSQTRLQLPTHGNTYIGRFHSSSPLNEFHVPSSISRSQLSQHYIYINPTQTRGHPTPLSHTTFFLANQMIKLN